MADGSGGPGHEAGHDSHDLERVVAFADGELTGPELTAAEAQVAACAECASLAADIHALHLADRALATPARPRDFRLTPADAARLAPVAGAVAIAAEPVAVQARLGEEMTASSPAHATHDPMLVAAADDALDEIDRRRVDEWLGTCSDCAVLRRDLLAIAEANRAMPTPARVRDHRLTPAEAERLRQGGWRGFLARIGTSRDTLTRPLAYGLTAIGLAGLLLSSSGSLLPFGASSGASEQILSTVGAPIDSQKGTGAEPVPGAAGGGAVFSGQAESPASDVAGGAAAPAASAAPSIAAALAPSAAPVSEAPGFAASPAPEVATRPQTGAAAPAPSAADREAASDATRQLTRDAGAAPGPSMALLASLALLVAGVALLAIRWVNRRRDPAPSS